MKRKRTDTYKSTQLLKNVSTMLSQSTNQMRIILCRSIIIELFGSIQKKIENKFIALNWSTRWESSTKGCLLSEVSLGVDCEVFEVRNGDKHLFCNLDISSRFRLFSLGRSSTRLLLALLFGGTYDYL